MTLDESDVTTMLARIRTGDEAAQDELFSRLYEELAQLAHRQRRGERLDHSLQTTALVHEAYVRLVSGRHVEAIKDRRHFFALASRVMRQLLVDHARRRKTQKAGGQRQRVSLDLALAELEEKNRVHVVDLDSALSQLGQLHSRQAQVIEMRFFGGMSVDDVAEHLGISRSTVEKDFQAARAWLRQQLS